MIEQNQNIIILILILISVLVAFYALYIGLNNTVKERYYGRLLFYLFSHYENDEV